MIILSGRFSLVEFFPVVYFVTNENILLRDKLFNYVYYCRKNQL
jgi:hypothetical protein